MNKELQLEEIFYMIQLAVQSAIGEDKEFTIKTEQQLDNIYHKLKVILK
jgi:hypothetical protein